MLDLANWPEQRDVANRVSNPAKDRNAKSFTKAQLSYCLCSINFAGNNIQPVQILFVAFGLVDPFQVILALQSQVHLESFGVGFCVKVWIILKAETCDFLASHTHCCQHKVAFLKHRRKAALPNIRSWFGRENVNLRADVEARRVLGRLTAKILKQCLTNKRRLCIRDDRRQAANLDWALRCLRIDRWHIAVKRTHSVTSSICLLP